MYKIEINNFEKSKSEIIFQDDLVDYLNNILENKNCFLITNTTLSRLYPQILYKFQKDKIIVIKDGEKYKNFKTYNYIMEQLLSKKIERKDTIVALGGGVVGDLAGFCASTILRGVELIQIPTTLLAMCDSAIGGKTGYNTKYGKNLIGSFYKASKVLIDTTFLNTLNNKELKCGMGEIIKYALIEKSCKCNNNYDLLDFLIKNQKQDIKNEMKYIINACANLKVAVVEQDEKEGGLRKILNFGHTFAHPIETLTNYKKFSHGEAVAYGIKYASKLALSLNKIDEEYYNTIINLLEKLDLATKKVKFNKKKFIELMKQDKKVENKNINLLLPTNRCCVGLFDNISEPLLEACLP